MSHGERREIAAAVALILFGMAFAVYAALFLTIGSFASMGPGMFPLLVGVVIAGLGLIHGATTLVGFLTHTLASNSIELEPVQWHSMAVVIASIAVFSVVIEYFGLIPGIVALTVVASFGSERLTLRLTAVVAVSLVTLAWLVFIWALGLPFPLFEWPF